MGSLFHPEALLFCLAWIVLAATGYILEGWVAGALLTFGLLVVLMPATGFILSKFDDFGLERTVRWSILIAAGAGLALVHALRA